MSARSSCQDQTEPGGLVNDYPFVAQGWSDNQLGDFWVGGKVNLLSEYRQNPMAFAVRGHDEAALCEGR